MQLTRQSALLSLALFAMLSLSAAELRLSNRPPQPDEWGYRPADGATVPLNPPSLTWIHETNAIIYTVQWARTENFSDATTVSEIPWPTYTHHAALAAGSYFWRYKFAAKSGDTSNWSVARKFTIPAQATDFPMPTRAQQSERVPKQHPRLFMRPEDLPRLRELAQGREAKAFARLRADADRIIRIGPTPEPTQMGSARDKENAEAVKYWWPNRQQTEKACMEAETLAFVYLLTQDKEYGQAARRWLVHLASWNPDGPTNFKVNCEAGKPMLYRPARAYDWAWDMFTHRERTNIQAVMQRRVKDAWESGEVQRGVGHLNRPYNSHGNRVWHKIAEAGIAFLDEIPEAPTWLDYAVNKFYASYPVWSDDDGGWHEGVSYWAGYMNKSVWWLQVSQSALGIDGLKKPFFAKVGDYPLYIAPPGSPNSGFGDLAFNPPSKGIGGFMEYHLRVKGHQPDGVRAGYWRWWTEQWGMKGESGILGFLYAANLPDLPPAKPPADLPPSKVFHGIGVASLHTTLLDAKDDVHFLMKSSPFGSQSHGHNPQNIFQLNAYGEPLLTTCVYRDLHGSKFHYGWVHSTVAHNGVLVNGQGQEKHKASAPGRFTAERFTPEWDYVCGDATPAYGGRLTRALRHAVLVKGETPFIVLYDDLAAKEPSTFQFMLHALKPFIVDELAAQLSVTRPNAGVTVKYLSTQPLAFRQWDGFQPKPSKEFPNQWHVEAATQDQRADLAMLTVIVPNRAGKNVEWQAERIDRGDAAVAQIRLGGKKTVVTFSKSAGGAPKIVTEAAN
ncbi:MAG: DUF4962 domain-containing protein [Verrucomicrobia bacterium]|nr:DUF4962 domain-containing protein [Verrucomicrobiota bacterium]